MKYIANLFALIIFCNSFLIAQKNTKSKLIDKDKTTYEENVFNKEFDEFNDTSNAKRKQFDLIPEKLPEWVFKPVEIGNTIKIVGFSDPNMDKKEAYQQAILRAKVIFGILNYSTISNITDDYTNLRESSKYALYETKFQDFSISKAIVPYNNSAVLVVDTFFTKYNEGIVLIEFNHKGDSKDNKDTLIVKGEHLQIFVEKNFRKEKIEFFNFSTRDMIADNDSSDFISQYIYKVVNRGYDISSMYGNKTIEFEERTYNYRTELEFKKDSTDSELNVFRLNRGLWNAYISGVLSNITALSKDLSSRIKNSNDFYTLKSEGLIRTVARNKVSFGFNSFKMDENQFYIELNGNIRQ